MPQTYIPVWGLNSRFGKTELSHYKRILFAYVYSSVRIIVIPSCLQENIEPDKKGAEPLQSLRDM